MKGLLIKDLNLMKMQKKFLAVIVAIAVCMTFSMNDVSFILGYLTFLIPFFALSTISYDEYDNGNAFLFSLPITRKEYVIEKYVFCLLLGIGSYLLAILLTTVFGIVKNSSDLPEILTGSPLVAGVMLLFLSLMLPMQLKYGAEKGRIAMIILCGIFFALGYGILNVLKLLHLDLRFLLETAVESYPVPVFAVIFLFLTAAFLISMKISIGIMKKKEF